MSLLRIAILTLLTGAIAVLAGCSSAFTSDVLPPGPVQSSLGKIQGSVHGGQQAVIGAKVYVYATGTAAYAGPGIAASTSNASTSLLTSAVLTNNPGNSGIDGSGNYYVTTDSMGMFLVTGDYTCTLGTDVYIYVTGGNPGAGTNTAAGFLALLGPCPSTGGSLASAVPFVTVNEVTTIAAAYAVAGFASDPTHISNSGSTLGIQGLANAFATSNELVNVATGTAYPTTPAGNSTVPQTLLNSLANILASCVNANGAMTSSPATTCYTLFTDTGTGTSLDAASVAINLAHAPAANVSALFALQASSGAPFLPDLSSAPTDFSVSLSLTGGGLMDATTIAIDSSGNVWLVNPSKNSISEFRGGTGAAISPSSGFTGGGLSSPEGIAIDPPGNVWVANASTTPYRISEFNGSTGAPISTSSGFTGGGLNGPYQVAIDGSGNVWLANSNANTLGEFNGSTGAPISTSSGFTGGGLDGLVSIVVDPSGNPWVANNSNSTISKFNGSTGVAISPSTGYTGGGLNGPYGIAVDASGNIWVTNYANSLSKFNGTTGAAISSSSGYTGGNLHEPATIAIDGAGNAWVANGNSSHISEFNGSTGNAIVGAGYYSASLVVAYVSIAIDGSGNVWVGGTNAPGHGCLVEFIGLATPIVTPLATAVKNNMLGTRP